MFYEIFGTLVRNNQNGESRVEDINLHLLVVFVQMIFLKRKIRIICQIDVHGGTNMADIFSRTCTISFEIGIWKFSRSLITKFCCDLIFNMADVFSRMWSISFKVAICRFSRSLITKFCFDLMFNTAKQIWRTFLKNMLNFVQSRYLEVFEVSY